MDTVGTEHAPSLKSNCDPLHLERCPLDLFFLKLPRREVTREHCLRDDIWRFSIADDAE